MLPRIPLLGRSVPVGSAVSRVNMIGVGLTSLTDLPLNSAATLVRLLLLLLLLLLLVVVMMMMMILSLLMLMLLLLVMVLIDSVSNTRSAESQGSDVWNSSTYPPGRRIHLWSFTWISPSHWALSIYLLLWLLLLLLLWGGKGANGSLYTPLKTTELLIIRGLIEYIRRAVTGIKIRVVEHFCWHARMMPRIRSKRASKHIN